MKDDIKSIWADVLDGDSNAWHALVERYTPLVLSVAKRGGLKQTDAEDCAQLTWVALYRSRHTVRAPERISSWLTRVAARKVAEMLRARDKDVQSHAVLKSGRNPRLPDEDLLDLERDMQLELAIQRLGPQCQRILRAFFFSHGDTSYRDVAKELNIAKNSLGPTRMRCLKKLRAILMKTGYPWVVRS